MGTVSSSTTGVHRKVVKMPFGLGLLPGLLALVPQIRLPNQVRTRCPPSVHGRMVVYVLRYELRQDSPPQELEAPLVNNKSNSSWSVIDIILTFLVEKEFKIVLAKTTKLQP